MPYLHDERAPETSVEPLADSIVPHPGELDFEVLLKVGRRTMLDGETSRQEPSNAGVADRVSRANPPTAKWQDERNGIDYVETSRDERHTRLALTRNTAKVRNAIEHASVLRDDIVCNQVGQRHPPTVDAVTAGLRWCPPQRRPLRM
ncbi:MAG: hypothetical protein M3279_05975 [Actinomycetota bacterium]|nr:hypothetical protein [Actinomycetota bacterium]